MELFNEKGCLTNEAFTALQEGTLDELGRLETAEHLAYCDRCMDRYTLLLSQTAPEQPQHARVRKERARRSRRVQQRQRPFQRRLRRFRPRRHMRAQAFPAQTVFLRPALANLRKGQPVPFAHVQFGKARLGGRVLFKRNARRFPAARKRARPRGKPRHILKPCAQKRGLPASLIRKRPVRPPQTIRTRAGFFNRAVARKINPSHFLTASRVS